MEELQTVINLLKGAPTGLFESNYFSNPLGNTHQWFIPLLLFFLSYLNPSHGFNPWQEAVEVFLPPRYIWVD